MSEDNTVPIQNDPAPIAPSPPVTPTAAPIATPAASFPVAPPATEVDPATGIHKPEIAEVTIDTVILKGSGEYTDGELFNDVVYRAPRRLWLTDMKGTVEGFKAWMRKHNPRYTDDFNVTLIREEATPADKVGDRPVV